VCLLVGWRNSKQSRPLSPRPPAPSTNQPQSLQDQLAKSTTDHHQLQTRYTYEKQQFFDDVVALKRHSESEMAALSNSVKAATGQVADSLTREYERVLNRRRDAGGGGGGGAAGGHRVGGV